jgi:hypothetical protein
MKTNTTPGVNALVDQPWNASYSYWIILVGVRQVITFGLAQAMKFCCCEFHLEKSRVWHTGTPRGRFFLLQAYGVGLPLTMDCMGGDRLCDSLWRRRIYQAHTGYTFILSRVYFEVVKDLNPSGQKLLPTIDTKGILILAICADGTAIALKRFVIGLRFGKTSYRRYLEKRSNVP